MTTNEPNKPTSGGCDCADWCDISPHFRVLTGHHETCPLRGDITVAWKQLVRELVQGMQSWAADDGGVHPDAWDAYLKGKVLLGEFDWGKDDETANAVPQLKVQSNE